MKSALVTLLTGLALFISATPAAAQQLPKVKVAYCSTSYGPSITPWAVARKLGYDKEEGIEMELTQVSSGSDCMKFMATGELQYTLASIEALGAATARGVKAKMFFNMIARSPYEIMVPADSAIKTLQDLKGKKIGVLSMSSIGPTIVRGLSRYAGLNPATDVTIVAVGEAQRAALFLKNKEIDGVSIFSSAHHVIASLGVPLRSLPQGPVEGGQTMALTAMDSYLQKNRREAIAIARVLAKGSAFTTANPSAALEMMYELYPQTLGTGRPRAEVRALHMAYLNGVIPYWSPTQQGPKPWGTSNVAGYDRYLATLFEWEQTARRVTGSEIATNEFIAEINKFDEARILKAAASYK